MSYGETNRWEHGGAFVEHARRENGDVGCEKGNRRCGSGCAAAVVDGRTMAWYGCERIRVK